jgi:NADH-quinone oxidoreductase subunit C
MDQLFLPVVKAAAERCGANASEFRGEVTLLVPPEKIVEACRMLRDEFAFDTLSVETAVDYYPQQEPRFHVVYIVYSTLTHTYLNLRAPVSGSQSEIDTVETVYPNANWREREIWDLFGIRFKGHSDLRRIMMPPNWEGHPLRKDYPLGYEEVEFAFNIDEINLQKPRGQR